MREPLVAAVRRHRMGALALFDGVAWVASLALFSRLRLDVVDRPTSWEGVLLIGLVAALLQLGFGWTVRLHHGRAGLGSFDEMLLLGGVTCTVGFVITVVNILSSPLFVPRSVPVAATFLTLAITGWGRAGGRRMREFGMEHRSTAEGTPTLILGAGEGGRQLIASMLRDRERRWRPVALLDDDPGMRHRRFRGLPVLGTSADLARVVEQTGCTTLVVAIPSASADTIRRINGAATRLGIDVKVLPGVGEFFDGQVSVSDIRDIQMADLLGRHQIDTDVESIAGYLTGQRVLVTGAGGSIGSELCRQIHHYGPAELIMLDRDESALHSVQLAIYGRAMLDSPDVVLADIRDEQCIMTVFKERRPDVVFHAAALKHLPMLEQYPGEAVKTNVWGTLTVLEAAKEVGVKSFVNISTDKAADPCSVLGYSKRIAEGLTAAIAAETAGTFLSVRFGNVLGSRGSVLATFAAQIASGGPVTVTHPEVTRYFMTVQEAVQLVIQAAAIGQDGEALVLDMGRPVKIADLAKQLIERSGRSMEIVYTGLRRGEKLHEQLFAVGEPDHRPVHQLVSHVHVPAIDQTEVLRCEPWVAPKPLTDWMRELCANGSITPKAQSTGQLQSLRDLHHL